MSRRPAPRQDSPAYGRWRATAVAHVAERAGGAGDWLDRWLAADLALGAAEQAAAPLPPEAALAGRRRIDLTRLRA